MLTILHAGPDGKLRETQVAAQLPEMLQSGTTWVDLYAPSEEENRILESIFRLHPLAIEDILQDYHHPKIDDFKDYVTIVVHGLRGEAEIGRLETSELDMALGRNWIITHRSHPFRSLDETMKVCRSVEGFLARGPHRVAQAIFDSQAGRFVERIDRLDEELSRIEEKLFSRPGPAILQKVFRIKRDLSRLKRIVGPQREVFNRLGRGEFAVIPAGETILFRDVYDHIYRVAETVDSLRDLATGALESYLSAVSHRTGEIIRVLTIISTIILPMNLVTGYYGMNFRHMEELDWAGGQFAALALMAAISSMLLWIFFKKRWL
jgi:magnesium transporter